MNIYDFGPIAAVLDAAYRVVLQLSNTLVPLAGTASAALAIVLVTIIVRTALIPVGVSQARAARIRTRLAPRIAELRRRYGTRPDELRRKLAELYSAENASPLAGCLPLLAQAPVISLIYGLFSHPVISGHANALLTGTLNGVPLGSSFAGAVAGGALGWPTITAFAALLAVLVAVALLSRRFLGLPQAATTRGSATDPASSRVAAALSYAPLLTAVFALFLPLAAGIYLATTTTWTLAERLILNGVV
ncbi:membrane protein insertase YidC [Rathayibacter sp. YIM 133350]|uniref:YidC/Oxa1 family membrane protein insertase n=1 Tax=Rathayibacter sp. YIM 133350 TaxID=3131992 RepID=UPI00307E32BE